MQPQVGEAAPKIMAKQPVRVLVEDAEVTMAVSLPDVHASKDAGTETGTLGIWLRKISHGLM